MIINLNILEYETSNKGKFAISLGGAYKTQSGVKTSRYTLRNYWYKWKFPEEYEHQLAVL